MTENEYRKSLQVWQQMQMDYSWLCRRIKREDKPEENELLNYLAGMEKNWQYMFVPKQREDFRKIAAHIGSWIMMYRAVQKKPQGIHGQINICYPKTREVAMVVPGILDYLDDEGVHQKERFETMQDLEQMADAVDELELSKGRK